MINLVIDFTLLYFYLTQLYFILLLLNFIFNTLVTIGHIVDERRGTRFQVMDTPGLLDRSEDERNEMERLTFASLAHLPTAVIFVIDPTGLSGEKSTFQAQLNVREYLKSRFPRRPWIDVVSKGDIEIPDNIRNQLPINHLSISVKTGQNIDILKHEIEQMLHSLQDFLLQQTSSRKTVPRSLVKEE